MYLMFQAENVTTKLWRRRGTTVDTLTLIYSMPPSNTLESSSNGKLYIMYISQLKRKSTNTYDSTDKI